MLCSFFTISLFLSILRYYVVLCSFLSLFYSFLYLFVCLLACLVISYLYLFCYTVPGWEDSWDREGFLEALQYLGDYVEPRFGNKTVKDLVSALDYNYSPWPYLDDHDDNRFQMGEESNATTNNRKSKLLFHPY